MLKNTRLFWPGIDSCGSNNTTLHINQACLCVVSHLSNSVDLFVRNNECSECDFVYLGPIKPDLQNYFVIDSSYAQDFKFVDESGTCESTKWFDDFGVYQWNVYGGSCNDVSVSEEPEKFWINITVVTAIYALIYFAYRLIYYVKNSEWLERLIYGNIPTQELDTLLGDPGSVNRNLARARRLKRVASIDAFRGLSVMLMVFVNYGGGHYSVFEHTPWNGLNLADVVFPFFIWVMGLSAVISLRSQLRATIRRKDIFLKVLKRSVILVCIGIVLNSGKSGGSGSLRIPGVLQRIGLTYFIVSSVELFFGRSQRSEQYGPWNICSEMLESMAQWFIVFLLAAAHVLLTLFLPVPDCPTGYLGPGGWANHSSNFNCTGGAAGYIDRLIFTADHIYRRPTSSKIFHSQLPFDPEGLLGVLTSVLMAFLGGHCGRIILTYHRTSSRVMRWLLWAIITGVAGGLLCSWSKEGGIIPVNKNLWSLSYVLATSSMAFFTFTIFYGIVDRFMIFVPLIYAGMNPFVIYIGHSIMNKQLPWRWTPFTTTHVELLFMDVTATVFWLIISFFMYRNNIFISI